MEEEDGIETDLVRVTTDFTPDLEDYDPAEDVDLYEEFIPEKEESGPPLFRKIWVQQCEAAEGIEADYGTQKALGYLIGEKLLNFLTGQVMKASQGKANPKMVTDTLRDKIL